MKKKGISEVVTTVIMVGLVMAAAAIIWGVVKNMLDRNLTDSENCAGNFDKVEIYSRATCYNPTSDEFIFYIKVNDVKLTKLLVSIDTPTDSKTIEIPKINGYSDVKEYNGEYEKNLSALSENSGKKYVLNISQKPESISVVPVIGGTQCSVSDTITDIQNC